ncbi:MAG: hypothetical protein ACUZ8I_16305 [Candidatus Scalindua sp.]
MNLVTSNSYLKNKRCIDKAEDLWVVTKEYLDDQFEVEFNKEESFSQRYSEMKIASDLIENGYLLEKKSTKGPDFLIKYKNLNIWIEVIAPKKGSYQILNSDESLDRPKLATTELLNEDELILKISSAIYDKKKIYDEYIKKGIVSQDDCKIIAINTSELFNDIYNPDRIPYVVIALYGIDSAWCTDSNSKSIKVVLERVEKRVKKNETEILMDPFMTGQYSNITGCLFDCSCIEDSVENRIKYLVNESCNGSKLEDFFNKFETYRLREKTIRCTGSKS